MEAPDISKNHKQSKRKSPLWEHAVVKNGRAYCKYCHLDFAPDNINRLKNHWAGSRQGIVACQAVPEYVQEEALKAIGNSGRKRKTASASQASHISSKLTLSVHSTSEVDETNRSLVPVKDNYEDKSSVANKKLARAISNNTIPLELIEAPEFVDYVKSVAACGPDYKLPSSSDLFGLQFHPEVEKYIRDVKNSWKQTGCTIMLHEQSNFIDVFICSHKGAVFLARHKISEPSQDYEFVSKIIEDIGAKDVVQLITNNDKVFSSVQQMLERKYPGVFLTRCAAHEIHSLLKAMYFGVEWVRTATDKALLTENFMYQDADILQLLRRYTNSNLKRSCGAKFASTYQMLQSILGNKKELQQLISSEQWSKLDLNKYERAAQISSIIQDPNFWKEVEEVLKIMEPCVLVLRLVESDGSTSGYLYEAMEKAKETIKNKMTTNREKYGEIFKLFEKSQEKIIQPIHIAAGFLNPHNMKMCFDKLSWSPKVNDAINFVVKNLVSSEVHKNQFTDEFLRYQQPDEFNELARRSMDFHPPYEWWDRYGIKLPLLQTWAKRLLGQICKSSYLQPSELKFGNKPVSKFRDDVLYLAMNSKMMEKFRAHRVKHQQAKCIDLENCDELPDYYDHDPEQGLEDDSKFRIESCCLHDKVLDENLQNDKMPQYPQAFSSNEVIGEDVLQKLIGYVGTLISHTAQDANVDRILLNTIGYVHQEQQQLQNQGNLQMYMSIEDLQEQMTAGHKISWDAGPSRTGNSNNICASHSPFNN